MTESTPPGVAFVAHCLLNQNSKTDGGARCPGIYSPLVDVLRERGWRIEQMPCPEHGFLGLHRFWMVKEQADTLAFRRHCRRQAKVVAGAIAAHVERGSEVVVIGARGQPLDGRAHHLLERRVGRPPRRRATPTRLVPGRGIFSEELEAELAERGLGDVRTTGIEHQLPGHDVAVERKQLTVFLQELRVEGDARGFRVAVCADALVNPEPGGLDALAVCERTGFGVMQLPATWYPDDVAAGWLEQVAEQLDEYLRRGYAVVLLTAARATPRPRASARRWPQRSRRSATHCRPSTASTGDADALEAFLRAQPVPAAAG